MDVPSELLNNLEANTIITIPDLNVQNVKYNYSFIFTIGNSRKVTIELYYENEFQLKPVMFLEFLLTKELSLGDSFYLVEKKINVTLPEYYQLSSNSKKLVQSTAQTTERGAQIAQVFMVAQNIINVGSVVAVKSLILMELIRFLRFVNIRYACTYNFTVFI